MLSSQYKSLTLLGTTMSIDVTWLQDCQFEITTEKGFKFRADADNEHAPCPTEILLSALGSCSATDVVLELQKQGVEVIQLTNKLTYTLTQQSPRLYDTANLHFIAKAAAVTEQQVLAAAADAIEKYCHVCLMLQPKIAISCSAEVHSV
jgi:putative redox protein